MSLIEPTDEMIQAFNNADYRGLGNADWEDSHIRVGLTAVLGFIAENYDLKPALCDAPHPTVSGAYCELQRGHAARSGRGHSATVTKAVDW